MPNLKYGTDSDGTVHTYTGEYIWNALNNCLDMTDTGEKEVGEMVVDGGGLYLADNAEEVTQLDLLEFKKELNKYTGVLEYGDGNWKYKYPKVLNIHGHFVLDEDEVYEIKFKVPKDFEELYNNKLVFGATGSNYGEDISIILYDSNGNEILYEEKVHYGKNNSPTLYVGLKPNQEYNLKLIGDTNQGTIIPSIKYYCGEGELL